ncbi:MAG: Superoxide dismutase [Candidatus Jorgensenbacteria bacterium GW2011_GWA1_48_11]|uniref:Superoxide dismutase n=1 Tax=Candidatus Jorgensenbacteria bacterium GW2011_GWA1_48_11 TaxID=1618660 RepID=A0A0G1UBE9_9BACT|nr:MAG: Superoxide dismutase [Candidatus Jorgensenbacteria bacterium GW2011_GWA1_48_11]KKW11938.1 MAG: Superoxide dismutase [Candidatus Jorgensenbacteria bacterium GW2011_GWB1_49_9]
MKHELPKLLYAYDALEPYIDARTMEIHYAKHHQAYVNKLNEALAKHSELEVKTIEELLKDLEAVPEDVRMAVRNHGGGHYNHSLFWDLMAPFDATQGRPKEPEGELAEAIKSAFGDLPKFKEQFANAAAGVFGSGWVWLTLSERSESKGLSIMTTPNQDTPVSKGQKPILGLDVWEHAYYLKYQNRRPEYVEAWWNVVNWEAAAHNLGK